MNEKSMPDATINLSCVNFDSVAEIYEETRHCRDKDNLKCLKEIVDLLQKHVKIKKSSVVFEPGAGTGAVLEPFVERGLKCIGGDVSLQMLKQFKKKPAFQKAFGRQTALLLALDATSLPIKSESVALCITNHLFHLVRDCRKALTEIKRVLKKEGHLVMLSHGVEFNEEDPSAIWKKYDEILKMLGVPKFKRIGKNDEEMLKLLKKLRARVKFLPCEDLRFQKSTTVEKILFEIENKASSNLFFIPDEVNARAIIKLKQWLKLKYGDNYANVSFQVTVKQHMMLVSFQ